MSEDETRRAEEAAAEYMRRISVADLVVSTVQTLLELGYRRTGLAAGAEDERDLEQARLAIETVRALVPVVESVLDRESAMALRSSLSQVQLVYARAAEGAPPATAAPDPTPTEPPPPRPRAETPRPKIWTPGGEV
jgi:hypothetical protein